MLGGIWSDFQLFVLLKLFDPFPKDYVSRNISPSGLAHLPQGNVYAQLHSKSHYWLQTITSELARFVENILNMKWIRARFCLTWIFLFQHFIYPWKRSLVGLFYLWGVEIILFIVPVVLPNNIIYVFPFLSLYNFVYKEVLYD